MWERRTRKRGRAARSAREQRFTVRGGSGDGGRVRLSPHDLLTGPVYTPRVFFYRRPLDGAALRAALERTLARYPIAAGRLRKDPDGGYSVHCTDAGVHFVEVHRAEPLPEHGPDSRAGAGLKRYLHQPNPFSVVDGDAPLLAVQLTRLADGGSVLGVALNHTLADGTSMLAFLESWSHELRGLPVADPLHDRTLLEQLGTAAPAAARAANEHYTVAGRLQHLALLGRLITRAGKLATVTVRFEPAELAALKDTAMADLAGTGRWVSTHDALAAQLWRVLAELRARPERSVESLGVTADLRARAGGAVPAAYWGNAACYTYLTRPAAELAAAPLGSVAEAVRGAGDQLTAERLCADAAFLDAQRAAGRSHRVTNRLALGAYRDDGWLALNNRSRLPFYRMDFGAGRPFWVEYPEVPFPWTVDIMPTPGEDGGRDVHLSLPHDQAAALRTAGWQRRLRCFA
ncbi:acyltransferase [Kitasatospora sp. LaBMicrA B282]|uniref:acyltransferase n=1 Tax=Kitasatospora sp. LaBMicrA B282 TaxID=3420949 RepID=UPI003D1168E6